MHRKYYVVCFCRLWDIVTHVIQYVLRAALEKEHIKTGVWVTASTGLAALALEGVTIHGATGLKRGNQKAKDSS